MWKLYDTLLEHLPDCGQVDSTLNGEVWSLARTRSGETGLAMMTAGHTIRPGCSSMAGLPVREAAQAVKSWNLEEASQAMAVVNACYNTVQRLESLGCYEPYDNYCTDGLDFTGKTVGVIGHMNMPDTLMRSVKDVFILERNPKPGDYPDSACEYLLPKCDVVLITGSSLVNKTLPRLLELCRNAYTIVTGPTVPMCPELLDLGIQRLAGMVVTDPVNLALHVARNLEGSPYGFGRTFLIKEGRL